MLAVAADEFLRVLEHAVAVAVDRGVVHLGIVVGQRRLHGGQFVATDATLADLLATGLGVEGPAMFALHDRQRQGPGVGADHQVRLALPVGPDAVLFPVVGDEGIDIVAVDAFERYIGAPVSPEQGREACLIGLPGAERGDQGLGGGIRTGKGLLRARVQGQDRQQRNRENTQSSLHGESPVSADCHRPGTVPGPGVVRYDHWRAPRAADWRKRDWPGRGWLAIAIARGCWRRRRHCCAALGCWPVADALAGGPLDCLECRGAAAHRPESSGAPAHRLAPARAFVHRLEYFDAPVHWPAPARASARWPGYLGAPAHWLARARAPAVVGPGRGSRPGPARAPGDCW
ncbi:hypothetical protein D3C86_1341800 [compost metagenome]